MTDLQAHLRKYRWARSAFICTVFVWLPLGLLIFWMLQSATSAK